jgi:hypothetical protein
MTLKVTQADQNDGLLHVNGNGLHLMLFQFGANFKADWYVHQGSQMQGGTTDLVNQWVMLSVEFNKPALTTSSWVNGHSIDSQISNSAISALQASNLRIGKYGQYGDADWGELVMTENLLPDDSDRVEGYLAHKWGLESDLPSSHAYKSYAP